MIRATARVFSKAIQDVTSPQKIRGEATASGSVKAKDALTSLSPQGENMIKDNERAVTKIDEAWQLIRAAELECSECNKRTATDLHNHRKEPTEWQAVCAICHAEIESRDCAWTPIGVLAMRYADTVRTINQMKNRIRLRGRLGWDAIEGDYSLALDSLDAKRKELKKALEGQAKEHPFFDAVLGKVNGIGQLSGALLLAVLERAQRQGIDGIRNQRRYFGLFPKGIFETSEDNQKYHKPCKWLISQALENSIQKKQGFFRDRYEHYRAIVNGNHPKWNKGHQFNETWTRVAREFMKVIYLEWTRWMGTNPGARHPDDITPVFSNWT